MFDLVGLDVLEKLLTQTRPNSRLKKSSKQPIKPRKTQLQALGWLTNLVQTRPYLQAPSSLLLFYILQTLYLFFTIPFKNSLSFSLFHLTILSLSL